MHSNARGLAGAPPQLMPSPLLAQVSHAQSTHFPATHRESRFGSAVRHDAAPSHAAGHAVPGVTSSTHRGDCALPQRPSHGYCSHAPATQSVVVLSVWHSDSSVTAHAEPGRGAPGKPHPANTATATTRARVMRPTLRPLRAANYATPVQESPC